MATVRYFVTSIDTAIQFYTQYLGFTLVEQMGPAFAHLAKDDLNLWLSGPQTSAARPMPDGRQPVAGGWNRIVITVKDIETTVRTMQQDGVSFRNTITHGPGGAQILADDPFGNPIEIFQAK